MQHLAEFSQVLILNSLRYSRSGRTWHFLQVLIIKELILIRQSRYGADEMLHFAQYDDHPGPRAVMRQEHIYLLSMVR